MRMLGIGGRGAIEGQHLGKTSLKREGKALSSLKAGAVRLVCRKGQRCTLTLDRRKEAQDLPLQDTSLLHHIEKASLRK